MPRHVFKSLEKLTVGEEVTIWKMEGGHLTYGQGGMVTSLSPAVVIRAAGTDHTYDRAAFDPENGWAAEVEVAFAATECIEYGAAGLDCAGPVDPFDPTGACSGPLRCEHHRDLRADRYANSIESYAHSASAPSWFDPTYAGESWDE